MDPESGKCIFTKQQLATPLASLRAAMKDMQDGKFHADREKDELSDGALVNGIESALVNPKRKV